MVLAVLSGMTRRGLFCCAIIAANTSPFDGRALTATVVSNGRRIYLFSVLMAVAKWQPEWPLRPTQSRVSHSSAPGNTNPWPMPVVLQPEGKLLLAAYVRNLLPGPLDSADEFDRSEHTSRLHGLSQVWCVTIHLEWLRRGASYR